METKRVTVITPILTIVLILALVTLIKKTRIGMAMRAGVAQRDEGVLSAYGDTRQQCR